MALMHCPECEGSISNKAHVCPHCGFPIHGETQSMNYEYRLTKQTQCGSVGGTLLRAIAWILWIGGLILAISSSISSESYYYGYSSGII